MQHTREHLISKNLEKDIKFMWNKQKTWIAIGVFISLASCKDADYDTSDLKKPGIGINNAFVLDQRYMSHTPTDLKIQLDIGVVGNGSQVDITSIPDSAFGPMEFSLHNLTVDKVERVKLEENSNYSHLLAIEGSADWNGIDAFNVRTTSLNKALLESHNNSKSEFALGSFSRRSDLSSQATPWVWNPTPGQSAYNLSYQESGKILYHLYSEPGISSNLHDAMLLFLDYAFVYASNADNSITFLCENATDSYTKATISQIVERAKEQNIKINIIQIGEDYNWFGAMIALRTGGFLNIVSSTPAFYPTLGDYMDKGAPILGSLDRILSKNIHVYRVTLNLKKKTGSWTSGYVSERYYTALNWNDGSPRLHNYIPFYVQIP